MAEDNRKPSEDQAKRIRKMIKDRAPSTRKRSSQFVYWDNVGTMLGQPFNFTDIPLSKLDEMRRDPTLAFAMHYARVPIIRAPWRIEGNDAQVNAFVEHNLKNIYASFVLAYLNCWDYGYQAIVKKFKLGKPDITYIDPNDPNQEEKKAWDEGNIDAVLWDNFVALPPQLVEPDWNKKGEFNGILYSGSPGEGQFPFVTRPDNEEVKIDLEHSIWVVNEKESVFNSLWGFPRLGYAYPYWWSYWFRWALADRAFEKSIDPGIIVRFPDDEGIDEDGEEVDLREVAFALGERARSNDTVAFPSTLVEGGGIDDRNTSIYKWDIKPIENNANFEALDQTFGHLEIQKIQAVWVPEHSLTSGEGGQSSRNVAKEMTSSLKESQAVTMAEIDEHINRYMIPQLIEVNFPEKKNVTCKKITTGFASNDVELSKALVQLVGQSDPNKLHVNIKQTLEEAGVPVLTPQQIKAEEEKAFEMAQEMAAATAQSEAQEEAPAKGIPGAESGASSVKYSKDIGFDEVLIFSDPDSEYLAYVEDNKVYLCDSLPEPEREKYIALLAEQAKKE